MPVETNAVSVNTGSIGTRRRLSLRLSNWLLILPSVLFLLVFYLSPLAKLIGISLELPDLTLSHYVAFFSNQIYVKVFLNTFQLALVTTFFCLLLGYPTAYVLAQVRPRLRNLLLVLVVLPYLTSFLVRTYAWIIILYDRGIVNSLLLDLGLIDKPVKLVFNTFGVYIGMLHVMLPLMILPIYSVMRGIDPRLVRASYSLGCGPVRSFLEIYLPLSLPGVRSGCLLVFLLGLGFYITPALLGGLNDVMLVNFIDNEVTLNGNWEFGAATSVILLSITLGGLFLRDRLAGSEPGQPRRKDKFRAVKLLTYLRKACAACGLQIEVSRKLEKWRRRRWERAQNDSRSSTWSWPSINRPFAALVLVYLIVPTLIVIPMSFSSAGYLRFPPPGWSIRWYENFFSLAKWTDSALLSIEVAVVTTIVATLLGTMAAYGLVRNGATRGFTMTILMSPILVPPIILGVGLYFIYFDFGMIGTRLGLIIGHSIGSIAYVVIIVTASLTRFDFNLVRASMSLGAGPVRTFFRVTLPIIRPAIIASALFAFIHSFDELVISLLVSGIQNQTLPVVMWTNLRNEIDPTIAAVSTMLVLLPILWLLMLEGLRRGSSGTAVDVDAIGKQR